jgi:histidine ammonia-lyase
MLAEFRKIVSFNQSDRVLHTDMMQAVEYIANCKI